MRLTYPLAYYWIGIALQLLLAGYMYRQGTARRFPWFCGYLLYTAVSSAVVLAVTEPYWLYFRIYWIGIVGEVALGLAVAWELYKACLTPYPALRQTSSLVFLGTILGIILVATLFALVAPGAIGGRTAIAALALHRSQLMVVSGCLLVLLGLTVIFKVRWPQYAFGIAAGFAGYVLVQLFSSVVTVEMGEAAHASFKAIAPLAWMGANVVYTATLLRTAEATTGSGVPAEPLVRWNERLSEFLGAR